MERFFASVTLRLLDANHLSRRFSFGPKEVQEKIVDLLKTL